MTIPINPNRRTYQSYSLKDLLFAPFGCLLSIPPFVVFGTVLIGLIIFLFIFYNLNLNPFGIGRLDFSSIQYDTQFQKVNSANRTWTISYESNHVVTFRGLIRHISPIRDSNIPFLTHDILITSGEFSDSKKVKTTVINHHFQWFSPKIRNPDGTIHLLHTVPKNEENYLMLLSLKEDTQVYITGREIQQIQLMGSTGLQVYEWKDTGCNSILVTDVDINP